MDSTDAKQSLPELPTELVFLVIDKLLEMVPKRTLELMLLSRSIKPIVEKALYRAIVLESQPKTDLFVKMLESGCRPDSFYHTTIQALCITQPLRLSVLTSLFSACPAAQSIGISSWDSSAEHGSLAEVDALLAAGPRPSRLSVYWRWCLPNPHRFTLPIFQNVTHFQFCATSRSNFEFFDMRQLDPLTKLTHLSVVLVCPSTDAMPEFVSRLSLGDSIRVCIVYISSDYDYSTLESTRMSAQDPRVVIALNVLPEEYLLRPQEVLWRDLLDQDSFARQWGMNIGRDKKDIWEEAEDIVAARRALKAAGGPSSEADTISSMTPS
ncbi:hypothetical protein C8J56DRAFT_144297 [Mycena floridula]|nr:hypothetical protein C8J56DRAFT_144297 [Mycena floridula]